ncbi:MAG: hypothetical protein M3094_07420 [Actinomycetia bacterium]|nr:hypothetical protein [Actinomycetes bacterium]
MTLWRLEFLRLWRTQRWLILLAVFGVFGALGPLTARYLSELVEAFGGQEAIGQIPPMTSADGITQYVSNAQQMGLLAVAFIAASALALDAHREIAVFFRTRAPLRDIVVPRFVVSAAAAVGAFAVGSVIAFVGTGILLEWLDPWSMAIGVALQSLYLVFVVAVVAWVSSVVRSVPATALISIGSLIVLGLLSLVSPLAPWLPSNLVGALDVLIRGGGFGFWRSTAVTTALIGVLIPWAITRLQRREI